MSKSACFFVKPYSVICSSSIRGINQATLQATTETMKLIPATEEHYAAIGNLVTSPEELYLVCPNCKYPWNVEQLQVTAANRHALTVGIVDNIVVAFANLYDLVPQTSAFIGNVVIAQSHRGQGLGKVLIKHMMATCQDKYQVLPHISVFNDNTRALLLYTKLGFVPYAVEPRLNLSNKTVALIHLKYADHPTEIKAASKA